MSFYFRVETLVTLVDRGQRLWLAAAFRDFTLFYFEKCLKELRDLILSLSKDKLKEKQ